MRRIALMLVLGMAVMPAASQTPAQKPSFEVVVKPSFEVSSIRLSTNPASDSGFRGEPSGTRMTMTGVTVKMLLSFAYRVRDFQIVDGPDWINADRYDIQAKAEDGVTDELALCTQSLLEDRFQLKIHRDSRDLPVYELAVATGGVKMRLSADQSLSQRGGNVQRTPAGYRLRGNNVSLEYLIYTISEHVGRFILNTTDLKRGPYDIDLQWRDNGTADSAPADAPIFTALQEQLGLRLVSAKGPVEVIVIDSVQRPKN